MNHADFDFELVNDVVVIYDHDNGNISVTNDIDFVLASIRDDIPNLANKPVIYQDSDGRFDRVFVDASGHFAGFCAIGEKILEKALAKLGRPLLEGQ
ncbi:MAG: hypothetical protein HKM04_05645 [Legionellales bacterium]|nr:hypothetical protein [Legionellales bacterium]